MIKSKQHIEIVRSTTYGLSSISQESCDALLSVLAKHYAVVRVSVVNDLSDLEAIVARRPDLVFLGMEFLPVNPDLGLQDPDRIWLASYLEAHGIAYTGSGQTAHELERHKPLAKQRVLDAGLRTAPFRVIRQGRPLVSHDIPLSYPVFIKPTSRGGGLGIDSDSVAQDFGQLSAKVSAIATRLHSDSLVEEYLPGREFSVAILRDEYSAEYAVMPIELIAPPDQKGARILSRTVKSANAEQAIAVTDQATKAGVSTLALNVFHALGARDYGRIDIRLDGHGTPYFLEANLLPSLISGYGSFPKACLLNIQLDHEPMVLRIVRLGLQRAPDDSHELPEVDIADGLVSPRLEVAI